MLNIKLTYHDLDACWPAINTAFNQVCPDMQDYTPLEMAEATIDALTEKDYQLLVPIVEMHGYNAVRRAIATALAGNW